MATVKSYYEVLEISETATKDEIKNSYRFLSQAYHPDKFSAKHHREKAEEKFKQINEAYQVLSVDEKRKRYDASKGAVKKEKRLIDQIEIDFVTLKGHCTLIQEQEKVVMILIQSFTSSTFSVFYKRAGDVSSGLGEAIKSKFSINSGKTAAIKLAMPREGGMLNIYDYSSNSIEHILM